MWGLVRRIAPRVERVFDIGEKTGLNQGTCRSRVELDAMRFLWLPSGI